MTMETPKCCWGLAIGPWSKMLQVIWSPRFNTFSADLSPDGKEVRSPGDGGEESKVPGGSNMSMVKLNSQKKNKNSLMFSCKTRMAFKRIIRLSLKLTLC